MNINLNLAGEAEQLDALYAACVTYAIQQRKIMKNSILPEEHDKALNRLAAIELVIEQLDSLPAIQQE